MDDKKNLDQFAALVERMRESQKEYFLTRDRGVLNRSKRLEKEVDQFIERIKSPGLFA